MKIGKRPPPARTTSGRVGGRRVRLLAAGAALAVAWSALGCAHAPPATGDRTRGAPIDLDNPEINCSLNNTVDCRPASD